MQQKNTKVKSQALQSQGIQEIMLSNLINPLGLNASGDN